MVSRLMAFGGLYSESYGYLVYLIKNFWFVIVCLL